jgi:hypothetical protein
VGADGKRLTLAVDRTVLARVGVGAVFDAFSYQGRSVVAGEDDARSTDCLPRCT